MTPEPVTEEFCPVFDTTVEEIEQTVAKYAKYRKLTPEQLMEVAQRMIDATDPVEKDELREEFVRGWYGGVKDA